MAAVVELIRSIQLAIGELLHLSIGHEDLIKESGLAKIDDELWDIVKIVEEIKEKEE